MVPVIGRTFNGQGRFAVVGLLLPFALGIGFVGGNAAMITVDTHGAIAMIAMERAFGCIDRNLVVIDTQAIALGIAIGKQPGLQHFVRSEEHTSELQSLMRTSYAVFCLSKKKYSN